MHCALPFHCIVKLTPKLIPVVFRRFTAVWRAGTIRSKRQLQICSAPGTLKRGVRCSLHTTLGVRVTVVWSEESFGATVVVMRCVPTVIACITLYLEYGPAAGQHLPTRLPSLLADGACNCSAFYSIRTGVFVCICDFLRCRAAVSLLLPWLAAACRSCPAAAPEAAAAASTRPAAALMRRAPTSPSSCASACRRSSCSS